MFTLNCKERMVVIHEPVVVGIMNTTPDSFYPGSRINHINDLIVRAGEMIHDGARMIDIGGQSTRPGSVTITEEEELSRVIPAIEAIHSKYPQLLLSVDTFYAKVAKEAVDAGASIINDVSAGSMDPQLIPTVASLGVPYVLMHMKGKPETMQSNPHYQNVTTEVFDFLNFKIQRLQQEGIHDIIIDIGFGFGKTMEQNFQLLKELSFFQQLSKPLMVGLSRKATIYKTLDIPVEKALNGTTVLHTIALMNGATMLRVHDVLEAVQAVKLMAAVSKEKSNT